ncbi:hypothetical protein AYI69_g8754 [Smittium culicis]|uniref:Core-binding (CB) domain-containing protein n=1 Tax=Smittium culicis TaxID=133412 RepID=A0A1R1XHF0_9FUNG|nr:hypothetical protein AYI69_g8754 [Smittium culicis]
MELDIPGGTESPQRTSNTNLSNPVMENGNMVPGSLETISLPTDITTGNHCNTRPKKWKITAIEQQELASYGVDNQRIFLKTQGLSDSAINIIVSKEQSVSDDLAFVVNYLAHLFTTRKLSVNTIKSYKSAILNLVADPRTMENSHCMKEFLKAIEETEIKSFVNPVINITPVIEKLHEWGENNKLDIMKLTTKCCWLLALCGFLRASDIHRIDDARSTMCNGTVNIVNIAPKEKRKG